MRIFLVSSSALPISSINLSASIRHTTVPSSQGPLDLL